MGDTGLPGGPLTAEPTGCLFLSIISVPWTLQTPGPPLGQGSPLATAAVLPCLSLHSSTQPHASPAPSLPPRGRGACGEPQGAGPCKGRPVCQEPHRTAGHRQNPSPQQLGAGRHPRGPQPGLVCMGSWATDPGWLEWQLPPPLAALVRPAAHPAGELGRAAAMATAELLCCDIRAGVKSGTGMSQPQGQPPQDTCCRSTTAKDVAQPAEQQVGQRPGPWHQGAPGVRAGPGSKKARPPSPHRAAGDTAPLSCRISRSELAAASPAARASVPQVRGGRGQGILAWAPRRPPSHTKEGARLPLSWARGTLHQADH